MRTGPTKKDIALLKIKRKYLYINLFSINKFVKKDIFLKDIIKNLTLKAF